MSAKLLEMTKEIPASEFVYFFISTPWHRGTVLLREEMYTNNFWYDLCTVIPVRIRLVENRNTVASDSYPTTLNLKTFNGPFSYRCTC